jgi:hypothetical protein
MRQCMKRISPNTVHYSSALHLEIYTEYLHTKVTLACMQTDNMQLRYSNISLFNVKSNTKVSRRHARPTLIISLELIPNRIHKVMPQFPETNYVYRGIIRLNASFHYAHPRPTRHHRIYFLPSPSPSNIHLSSSKLPTFFFKLLFSAARISSSTASISHCAFVLP